MFCYLLAWIEPNGYALASCVLKDRVFCVQFDKKLWLDFKKRS
ncbi:hypothetical protein N202_01065 [Helicobacter pylori UM067]|nr:hypothetical protein N202_01065 [Helicobacter pylori UM067]